MEHITIQPIGTNEVVALQQISQQTFFETFASSNTEADMQQYFDTNLTIEKLLAELNNPESFFFIAWEKEEPVAYLKLNIGRAQTELQNDAAALEIERIYVANSHQGQKLGQLLYNKAVETARELGKTYIWLGVWEENHKAIQFYLKNGFVAFDQHIFVVGADEQTDMMMRKNID
jgi:ribosomal protein S18 acetylase RimI-like enzyme